MVSQPRDSHGTHHGDSIEDRELDFGYYWIILDNCLFYRPKCTLTHCTSNIRLHMVVNPTFPGFDSLCRT